jgi:hypothetical protein
MREDMFKVIVERPRWGSRMRGINRAADLDEDARAHESIKRRHVVRKSLNENLAPLRRWLEAQVDRPWDKVFAELCEHIDRRSTVQQHIHQHVEDFVDVCVVVIDGVRCVPGFGGGLRRLDGASSAPLFVDPDTGILRRNRARLRARKLDDEQWRQRRDGTPQCPHPRRVLGHDVQLHCLEGVWFEVRLAPVPARPAHLKRWDPRPFDVVAKRPAWKVDARARRLLFGDGRLHAMAKRQLDHVELARHGLHNDN